MIFDKKLVSGKEYLDAILANWEGYEPLRQRILNEVPHYGNADPYADAEMKYVIDLLLNISRAFSTHRCKVYKCGTFGASDHVVQERLPGRRRTDARPARLLRTPAARTGQGCQRTDICVYFVHKLCIIRIIWRYGSQSEDPPVLAEKQ
jgi:formate C-acetyltransferase